MKFQCEAFMESI